MRKNLLHLVLVLLVLFIIGAIAITVSNRAERGPGGSAAPTASSTDTAPH
jgi:hypothetical protein